MTAQQMRRRTFLELQHRAVGAGFRSGTYSGEPTRSIYARAHAAPTVNAAQLLGAVVVVGSGFFIGRALGRWLRKKAADGYLQGALVQAAG